MKKTCGCLGLLAGMVSLSCGANTARNAYANVSGENVNNNGDRSFVLHHPHNPSSVNVEANPGWSLANGSDSDIEHEIGTTNTVSLVGDHGEGSAWITITDDWMHTCAASNYILHAETAMLAADISAHQLILITDPAEGVLLKTNFLAQAGKPGKHVDLTRYAECEYPDCTKNGRLVTNEVTLVVAPATKGVVTASGETKPADPDGLYLLPGQHKVNYHAVYELKCPDDMCKGGIETNAVWDVCRLSVTNTPYLGIDLTDVGKTTNAVGFARACVEPIPENAEATYYWEFITEEHGKIGTQDDEDGTSVPYSNYQFKPSAGFENDKVQCTVTLKETNPKVVHTPCETSATASCPITVVKVDVKWLGCKDYSEEVTEEEEETVGGYAYEIPDDKESKEWTEEGTNTLVKIEITCEPSDLPKDETITLTAPGEYLYEFDRKKRTYGLAKERYTIEELNHASFFFHAHEKSAEYQGGVIEAVHDQSGARDKVKFTVFGRPLLVPDYDRNGTIDGEDDKKATDGKTVFRFWINNDDDDERDNVFAGGDGWYSDKALNVPEGGPNQHARCISGYSDLEDFTPLKIDISPERIFPGNTPDEVKDGVKWKLKSTCAGIVWTRLTKGNANDYLKKQYSDFGEDFDQDSFDAPVVRLEDFRDGKEIPRRVQTVIKKNGNYGIVLMEGLAEGDDMAIEGELTMGKKKKKLTMGALVLKIGYAEEMYRWMDLRSCLGVEKANPRNTQWEEEPRNGPDSDCNGLPRGNRHWVFAHGFNVNTQEARGWAATVFKRLWQTGDNSRFTFVNWAGDSGQFQNTAIKKGYWSVDYYRNSENAFNTASYLAARCNVLTQKLRKAGATDTYLMGHSLGNLLISEAIASFGLSYSRYYMLNAAVAMQAYNASEEEEGLMIDPKWQALKKKEYRASGWHKLFDDNDFRSTLRWPGRYSKIKNKYNVYSPSDDRLKNLEVKENDDIFLSSVWVLQERMKGTWKATLSDLFDKLNWKVEKDAGVTCEGGWGVNTAEYGKYYDGGVLTKASELTRNQMVKIPLFTPFENRDSRLNDLELFENKPDDDDQRRLRAVLLSDAIPATTYAAGANKLTCADRNQNLVDLRNESLLSYWPRGDKVWLHSDIKNVSYLLTRGFYEYLIKD